MTIASDIQALYIAYFNRPADFLGLKYWTEQATKAGSVQAVANAFSASPEYTAQYAGKGTADIINTIYTNLFGRGAEPAAIEYWGKLYDTKVFNIGNIATAILNGAQNDDKATITNKVAAANAFYAALDTSAEIIGYDGAAANAVAKAWLAGITTKASLDAATTPAALSTVLNAAIDAHNGGTGTNFNLTTSVDTLLGTSGNDVFVGDFLVNGNSAVQASDKITGGDGTDSLRLFSASGSAATTVLLPQLVSVENITLVNPAGTAATTLSLAGTTGVTEVAVEGAPAGAISFTGLTSSTNVLLKGNSASGSAIGATLSSSSASGKLTLSGSTNAGAVTFTGAGIEAINVNSTGTANNKVASLTVATGVLDTLNVTGDKKLTITGALTADTTTINSSGSTGGLTATFAGATHAAATVITGGTGVEDITLGAGNGQKFTVALGAGNDRLALTDIAVTATSTFAAGDGTDTLALANLGAALTSATGKLFTGFETLEVSSTTTTAQTYDPTLIAGITTYKVATSSGDLTLANLADGANVTLAGNVSGALTLNLKDDSGTANSLKVILNNGASSAAAGVTSTAILTNNVETITFDSKGNVDDDAGVNTVSLDTASTALKTVAITGDQGFSLTTGSIAANLGKIDASTATGDVTIDASAAAGLVNINGGAGNDTISAAVGGGAIFAGAKGDAITGGAGVDTLVYKLASDSVLSVKSDGTVDLTKIDAVTTFDATADRIDLTSFNNASGWSGTDKVVYAEPTIVANATELATLAATADFYKDASGINRGVIVVTDATGDVFLFADTNHDHKFDAATDLVIKFENPAAAITTANIIFG